MFQRKFIDETKTHLLHSILFFFPLENRAFYEIMCKNIVERDRPQMAIWRVRIASRITKATYTHSEYIILRTATIVARTLLSVTL